MPQYSYYNLTDSEHICIILLTCRPVFASEFISSLILGLRTGLLVSSSGRYLPASHRSSSHSDPGQFIWDCGGQTGTGDGFLRVLRFPLPILVPQNAFFSLAYHPALIQWVIYSLIERDPVSPHPKATNRPKETSYNLHGSQSYYLGPFTP
jgi:hypothetical protein